MQSHSTARQSPKSGYQRETIGACARTIGLRTRISRRAGRAQDAALQPAGVSPALSVCHASFAFAARATARGTRATDAAPETIEASLQLSEAVLVDIGVPMGLVIASIHEKRDEFRKILAAAGAPERPRSPRGPRRG